MENLSRGGVLNPVAPGTGPEEVYRQYKQEFDEATSYSQYKDVVNKYGSSEAVTKISEKTNTLYGILNAAFQMAKDSAPILSEISSIETTIDGNEATLMAKASTQDGDMTGTITMVKENGVWKIVKDSWS